MHRCTATLLLILLSTGPVQAESSFRLIATIGVDDDENLIPRPRFFVDVNNGLLVFSATTCEYFVVDGSWNVRGRFGRCGEGPGDFSRAEAAFVVGDELWTFQRTLISITSLSGDYSRSISLLHEPLVRPVRIDAGWLGVDAVYKNRVVLLAPDGSHIAIPLDLAKKFDSLRPLVSDDSRILYFGSHTSLIYELDLNAARWVKHDLGLRESDVSEKRSPDGSVSHWTPEIMAGLSDGQGGCYLLVRSDNDFLDQHVARTLRHYDRRLEETGRVRIDPEFCTLNMGWSARGKVVILDEWGSRVFVGELSPPSSQ